MLEISMPVKQQAFTRPGFPQLIGGSLTICPFARIEQVFIWELNFQAGIVELDFPQVSRVVSDDTTFTPQLFGSISPLRKPRQELLICPMNRHESIFGRTSKVVFN